MEKKKFKKDTAYLIIFFIALITILSLVTVEIYSPKNASIINSVGEAFNFKETKEWKKDYDFKQIYKEEVLWKKMGDCFPGYFKAIETEGPQWFTNETELFSDLEFTPSKKYNSEPTILKEGSFIVVVPKGYEYAGKEILKRLPDCEKKLTSFIGFCKHWNQSIYYFFKVEPEDSFGGKTVGGIVYISLIDNGSEGITWKKYNSSSYWKTNPYLCVDNPLIVHESTHSFISHEGMPPWADEGLAYYTTAAVLNLTTECYQEKFLFTICLKDGCMNKSFVNLSSMETDSLGVNIFNSSLSYAETKKTAMCMWERLFKKYGQKKMQGVLYSIQTKPPIFLKNPSVFISVYFVPTLGKSVWREVWPFGLTKEAAES